MAWLSKALGVVCFAAAGVMLMLTMALFQRTDWDQLDGTADEITLLAGLASFSLLLAAVGAAAWIVGQMAEGVAQR